MVSKPRYGWWGYVKDMIRRYPALCTELHALHRVSAVAELSGEPHGQGVTRPVEALSLCELSGNRQREYEAVRRAVEATKHLRNGRERLLVIDAVFWTRRHTLEGAALLVPCHYKTAQEWHNAFIRTVARNFGLLDE